MARTLRFHGRWDDAIEELHSCRELADVLGNAGLGATLHTEQFMAARRWDFDGVRRVNDEMLARAPSFALAPRDAVIGGLNGEMPLEQLRGIAAEWAALVPHLPYWVQRGSTAWMMPVVRHAPPDVARKLDELYAPFDGLWISGGVHETQGHVGWFRGALAQASRDLDSAIAHNRVAADSHREAGEGPIRANYSVWLVEALLSRGRGADTDHARRVVDDVVQLADRLEIGGLGELAVGVLAEFW